MKINNYLNLLGLASRARCLASGETLLKMIASKQVYLVLIARDASQNSLKKITNKCQYYQVDYFIVDTTDVLSKAIGKNNRVAVGITEQGFANKIKKEIGG